MSRTPYLRLAFESIRKNGRIYFPYLLASTLLVAVSYIVLAIADSQTVRFVVGEDFVIVVLRFGFAVVIFFSAIFLLYAQSFLMKSRIPEFGLYHILGMSKANIAHILLWESLILAIGSIGLGLAAGMILSKFSEMAYLYLLNKPASFELSISPTALSLSAISFAIIQILLYFNASLRLSLSNTREMLQKAREGERPPKGNWLLGLAGLVLLLGAYTMAIKIENPVSAFMWFFVAVLMVIAGTYLIMIFGSVLFVRLLKRNKTFYYNRRHFVSISSMAFRLKRNGAGLASICILTTMVLVTLSATASLYFGQSQMLSSRYPRQEDLNFWMSDLQALSDENTGRIFEVVEQTVTSYPAEMNRIYSLRKASTAGQLTKDRFNLDVSEGDPLDLDSVYNIIFVPAADVERITGEDLDLKPSEALIYSNRTDYGYSTIMIGDLSWNIVGSVQELNDQITSSSLVNSMVIVIEDLQVLQPIAAMTNASGYSMISPTWVLNFDDGLSSSKQADFDKHLLDRMSLLLKDQQQLGLGLDAIDVENRVVETQSLYNMVGSFFYLGILLSLVFMAATVLIIYYKQIAEGYEDQARFEIMQKVGMNKKEIAQSIRSQLLMVFFLPFIMAVINLAFAFPIVDKLLMLFGLSDTSLFLIATLISTGVFFVFYVIVYLLSAQAHLQIVSSMKIDVLR